MKQIELGRTGIMVSDWCLGTMTFGNQTPVADAHAQIDRALDAGITFIDTAEMYPVNPVRAETIGRTEEIIGQWVASSGRRNEAVIATKIAGDTTMVRDGRGYDGATILTGVDAALRRLQTDRIDLFQLHWPMRGSYMFRQNWRFDPSRQDRAKTMAHMADVLGAMDKVVRSGKVRAFGLSNESAWGTAQWLRLADDMEAPRVASIQNEYSLLCRLYDTDLAELAVNEDVLLMAFSPLAAGLLTGKYQGGAVPEASRMSLNGNLGGRKSARVFPAVDAYLALAAEAGLDPVHMAMAWLRTRPFAVSATFGATTVAQLEHTLNGVSVTLSPDLVKAIDATHKAHPMPY